MTWVQLPLWGEPDPPPPDMAGFSDVLFTPALPPEPDPEQSPEDQQLELFHGEAAGEHSNYANDEPGDWHRAGRDMAEVCVLSGWPPRHQQVGRHCPHGLTSAGDEVIIDYTSRSQRGLG